MFAMSDCSDQTETLSLSASLAALTSSGKRCPNCRFLGPDDVSWHITTKTVMQRDSMNCVSRACRQYLVAFETDKHRTPKVVYWKHFGSIVDDLGIAGLHWI